MTEATRHPAYDAMLSRFKEIHNLSHIVELLQWDQEVMMPRGGAHQRAENCATLEAVIHQRMVDPGLAELLDVLEALPQAQLSPREQADIREARRRQRSASQVPEKLVSAIAKHSVISTESWTEARKQKDFGRFLEDFKVMLELKREYADALRGERSRYDALLDEYEPDEASSKVKEVFAALRPHLVELVEKIQGAEQKTDPGKIQGEFSAEDQKKYCQAVLAQIGFNFKEGRLDQSTHPFCSGSGSDVRITTRYAKESLEESLFGCLHEGGHGLYEQGLSKQLIDHPSGGYASLGLHESQSRLWENFIGRSKAFWEHSYPSLQEAFPQPFGDLALHDFWRSINHVTPSLIRTEADEVTYNLHIILRFEFEWALLEGELSPQDLPEAWDQRYQRDFGITPPDHAQGCLQDIHWAAGLFGYFPTYCLGNLYAAQLFEHMGAAIGLEDKLRQGDFTSVREWLREHIHAPGRLQLARDLVESVTDKPATEGPFVAYLNDKYGEIYGL